MDSQRFGSQPQPGDPEPAFPCNGSHQPFEDTFSQFSQLGPSTRHQQYAPRDGHDDAIATGPPGQPGQHVFSIVSDVNWDDNKTRQPSQAEPISSTPQTQLGGGIFSWRLNAPTEVSSTQPSLGTRTVTTAPTTVSKPRSGRILHLREEWEDLLIVLKRKAHACEQCRKSKVKCIHKDEEILSRLRILARLGGYQDLHKSLKKIKIVTPPTDEYPILLQQIYNEKIVLPEGLVNLAAPSGGRRNRRPRTSRTQDPARSSTMPPDPTATPDNVLPELATVSLYSENTNAPHASAQNVDLVAAGVIDPSLVPLRASKQSGGLQRHQISLQESYNQPGSAHQQQFQQYPLQHSQSQHYHQYQENQQAPRQQQQHYQDHYQSQQHLLHSQQQQQQQQHHHRNEHSTLVPNQLNTEPEDEWESKYVNYDPFLSAS